MHRFGCALLAGLAFGAPVARAQAPAAALFQRLDADGNGRVSWDEVWRDIERRFAEADTNRDATLSPEEWLAAQLPARPPQPNRAPPDPQRQAERRAAMYRGLDANRDNRLTLDEIRPVAEAWFRAFDANADGVLSPEEAPRPRPGEPPPR